MADNLILVALTVGIVFQIWPVQAVQIQFYERKDFVGYLFETDSAPSCTNVPSSYSPVRGSIKTDTCLMVYWGSDCSKYSLKILPGGQNVDGATWNGDWYPTFGVSSYHVCNEKEGGEQLDVEIYNRVERGGSIVATYKDVCSCQNLPKDLHSLRMSVDNHGNSMKVYSGQDCSGESKVIIAGRNPDSDKINNFDEYDEDYRPYTVVRDIKSIGPYQYSTYFPRNCVKLYSNVYKFEFLESIHEDKPLVAENVELAAKTTFRNNGSAKLTQEYSVSKKVREAVAVTIASSLTNMHKVGVEASLEVESKAGVPFVAQSSFKVGLKTAYEYTRTSSSSDSKSTTVENERTFTLRQVIEVPPCTEYTVQGFVRMVKNRPIDYKVYAKVTGELGKEKMTTTQIREHMDKGLEYVKDFDANTVIVIARGQMTAEYGVDSVLSGDGHKIPGCVRKRNSKQLQ